MLYKHAMAMHHLQGFFIAGLILMGNTPLMICGVLWFFGYIAYQFGCYWRKRDSVGLDILDMLAGFVIGVIVYLPHFIWSP